MSLEAIWPTQKQLEVMDPDATRETVLDRAVAAGKILSERRDHYRNLWDRDLPGTVRLLASLAPGPKPIDARRLNEMERPQEDDLLAAARAAFPELRRRATRSRSTAVAPRPAAHRAGWYRRTNGSPVVKDAGRSLAPWWQNYVPPERGEPGQQFVDSLQSGPTPFPAGLNVAD